MTTQEKNPPVWTDGADGVEVSIYRNETKSDYPLYKESRRKWRKVGDKQESSYTLTRGETLIANALSADGWRVVGEMIRKERAAILASKRQAAELAQTPAAPAVAA